MQCTAIIESLKIINELHPPNYNVIILNRI